MFNIVKILTFFSFSLFIVELAKTSDTHFGNGNNVQNKNSSIGANPNSIDFASAMRACQVISSEVDIEKLLCSMVSFFIICYFHHTLMWQD